MKQNKYKFLFKINNTNLLSINMPHNTSVIFSRVMLIHRQARDIDMDMNDIDDMFFNVASYGNKRIFSHIKQSFLRSKNNNQRTARNIV